MKAGPVRALHALLAAAAIGLLVNVVVFGPGHLLGTSAYWDFPEADSQSNLVGYRYFLHEAWHWPLLNSAESVRAHFFVSGQATLTRFFASPSRPSSTARTAASWAGSR